MDKQCIKCGLIKPIEEFYKRWGRKGYRNECKQCCRDYKKIWRKNNPESCSKSTKKYYINKTTKSIEQRKQEKMDKLNIAKKKDQKWHIKNWLKRYHTDIQFNLAIKFRRQISEAIRSQFTKKAHRTLKLLDCTFEEFKIYFENLFTGGMTWDLFMQGKIHIDHIKPCSRFDLTDESQQRECFHYTNLQPLWAIDNIRKSNKILLDI